MNAHPYREYEGLMVWKIIDGAVSDLVANQDLKEMTGRGHIVGYLVKRLVETGVLAAQNERLPKPHE